MLSPGIGDERLSNPDPLEAGAGNFTEHWARCGVVEQVRSPSGPSSLPG
ncbi:hypothetical protein AB0M80_43910 [Amycolatopsis sp. NPDC051045]